MANTIKTIPSYAFRARNKGAKGLMLPRIQSNFFDKDTAEEEIWNNWLFNTPKLWTQKGNALSIGGYLKPALCALTSSRFVAYTDSTIRVYDFDGTTITPYASLTVGILGTGGITRLTDTSFALAVQDGDTLRYYSMSGTTITLGGTLSIGGTDNPSLATLSSDTVVLADQTLKTLRTYLYSAGAWTQIGSSLAAAGGFAVSITALSSTRIVMWEGDNGQFRTFDWSGSVWTETYTQAITYSTGVVQTLSPTRIAYINDGSWTLKVFNLVAGVWIDAGINRNLVPNYVPKFLYPALAGLSPTRIVYDDGTNDSLFIFDLNLSDPVVESYGSQFFQFF